MKSVDEAMAGYEEHLYREFDGVLAKVEEMLNSLAPHKIKTDCRHLQREINLGPVGLRVVKEILARHGWEVEYGPVDGKNILKAKIPVGRIVEVQDKVVQAYVSGARTPDLPKVEALEQTTPNPPVDRIMDLES